MTLDNILIRNGYIQVPTGESQTLSRNVFATIVSNLAYYGCALNREACEHLICCNEEQIKEWWKAADPIFADITGDNRSMADFVVYKNFPQETLSMSESEYWERQYHIYMGFDTDLFTQEPIEREKMAALPIKPKVLGRANDEIVEKIYANLLAMPNRWTDVQYQDAVFLSQYFSTDASVIPFKENMVRLAVYLHENGKNIAVNSGMDVFRIATHMSGGDITFKEKSRFRNFKRAERQFLLNMLERCGNLQEDMQRNPNKWKRLMRAIRPGDYAKRYPNVVVANNALYNKALPRTYNSKVNTYLAENDKRVLSLLQKRPGEFVRRLRVCLNKFGQDTVDAFSTVVGELNTIQLLKIKKFMETVNLRKTRMFAPRGNWGKVKVEPNVEINSELTSQVVEACKAEVANRMNERFDAVNLDPRTENIKLQTNDSELTPYGRGTVFPLGDNINYIRSASYWKNASSNVVWYDNGWNFFNEEWKSVGACSWTNRFNGANFSGDPVNINNKDGQACQMIDLDINRLLAAGVRYAVWNILCYSNKSFNEAVEVFASMQLREDAFTGKLFEPSSCEFAFPVKGDNMCKYIAYLDLKTREIVYMDANFSGHVASAGSNGKTLEEKMPAFEEYLSSLPTVHDLFEGTNTSEEGTVIAYSDEEYEIEDAPAYVFKRVNKSNNITPVNLSDLL